VCCVLLEEKLPGGGRGGGKETAMDLGNSGLSVPAF